MRVSSRNIRDIQEHLEAVTNQPYKEKIVENDKKNLLIVWQNDTTHIDYLVHIMALDSRMYQIAFAVQKYRDIETRFDRRVDRTELERLLMDPRLCVMYLVGQIR